jgi:hypothetical protein
MANLIFWGNDSTSYLRDVDFEDATFVHGIEFHGLTLESVKLPRHENILPIANMPLTVGAIFDKLNTRLNSCSPEEKVAWSYVSARRSTLNKKFKRGFFNLNDLRAEGALLKSSQDYLRQMVVALHADC